MAPAETLNQRNLRDVARMVQPPEPAQPSPEELAAADYDVEHLDFKYVATCADVNELRILLAILKSGKEGYYPALEESIAARIDVLDPSNCRPPVLTAHEAAELTANVKKDLASWISDVTINDEQIRNDPHTFIKDIRPDANDIPFDSMDEHTNRDLTAMDDSDAPSISITHTRPEEKTKTSQNKTSDGKNSFMRPLFSKKNPDRIRSSDYRAWDKFDPDKDLERIDAQESALASTKTSKKDPKASDSSNKINNQSIKFDATRLAAPKAPVVPTTPDDGSIPESTTARLHLANLERYKGNDSFRAGDYDEALAFFTRSLHYTVTANALCNRSLTYFRLQDYASCESDATNAIQLDDPEFIVKAYIRRAQARTKRGKYVDALHDYDNVLERSDLTESVRKDTESRRAICLRTYQDVYGREAIDVDAKTSGISSTMSGSALNTTAASARRMVIEEVEDEEDDQIIPSQTSNNTHPATQYGSMNIGKEVPPAAEPTSNPYLETMLNIVEVDDDGEDYDFDEIVASTRSLSLSSF